MREERKGRRGKTEKAKRSKKRSTTFIHTQKHEIAVGVLCWDNFI